MSDMKNISKSSLWVERYRPKTIKDLILPKHIMKYFQNIIQSKEMSNMLCYGSAGKGKSSAAFALCKDLDAAMLFINASIETGIDTLRYKVQQFAMTSSFSGGQKVVILDECLEENEKIRIGTVDNYSCVCLKDLEFDVEYPVVSFNLMGELENDTAVIISDKFDEVYEVELEDGRIITLNSKHPFLTKRNGEIVEISIEGGLCEGMEIITTEYQTNEANTQLTKVRKITKLGIRKVRNLAVEKNHTFITANGIITHNCDRLSPAGQDALKALIEQCESNCRFIITTNNLSKIIDPIKSRTQLIDFNFSPKESEELMIAYFKRVCWILDNENIVYDKKILAEFVKMSYPDFRKTLSELQKYIQMHGAVDDKIFSSIDDSTFNNLIDELRNRKFNAVRRYATEMSADSFYGTFYAEIDRLLEDKCKPDIILILADSAYKSSLTVNKELELVACLTNIMRGASWK